MVAHAHDHLELARRPRDGDALYARGAHAQQHVQVVGVDLADLLPARRINFRLSYRGPKRKQDEPEHAPHGHYPIRTLLHLRLN